MYTVSGGHSGRDCILIYYKLRQMMAFKNTGLQICRLLGMYILFRKVMIRILWIKHKQLYDNKVFYLPTDAQ